jgi:plasmid stabilization system protein ParE
MNTCLVAPEAEEDIFHIWLYLLREAGMETANRIEREILEALGSLAETPGKGHRRPDLTRRNVLFYNVVPIYGRLPRWCSTGDHRGAAWQTQREAASQSATNPKLDSSTTPLWGARRIITN